MISTTPRRTDIDPGMDPAPDSEPPTFVPGPRSATRVPYLLVLALAVLILAAGAVYYFTSSVEVELSVDGQAQPIETRADTVAELLADQAIDVGDQDLIKPSLDTELTDGTPVVIRYARTLNLTVDGVETSHVTTELTIGDALDVVEAPVDGAAVSAPLDQPLARDGVSVEIITPKSIILDVGGQSRSITTTAETVEDVLMGESVVLSETDSVRPPPDTIVTEDMSVIVTRIRVENETRTETIAHDTEERKDGDLTVGTRTTSTEGADGEKEVTYAVTYTNGEITSEEPISTTVTKEPVTEVVVVGTKPAPVAPADPGVSAGGEAAGLNWGALAECESSGNPTAVNPAGYYGLYQFSLSTWASVGGSGNPVDASVAEQTNRAQILYNKAGAGQWPHCGKYLFG